MVASLWHHHQCEAGRAATAIGEAGYAFWQVGDPIKNDEPQGNQFFCLTNESMPVEVKAMRVCIKETGESAEPSTGTKVSVYYTDAFAKSVEGLVHCIDPENAAMNIIQTMGFLNRNIMDGRAMLCSILMPTIGDNRGHE